MSNPSSLHLVGHKTVCHARCSSSKLSHVSYDFQQYKRRSTRPYSISFLDNKFEITKALSDSSLGSPEYQDKADFEINLKASQ